MAGDCRHPAEMGIENSDAAIVDAVEQAVLRDGVLVLRQRIHLDNAAEMSAQGYALAPADEEGLWATKQVDDGQIRIGVEPGKPGCSVRFEGALITIAYEALLQRLLERGFVLADGKRKPAEPQFVLDTLIRDEGDIGILVMFRTNHPAATMFAIMLYPS